MGGTVLANEWPNIVMRVLQLIDSLPLAGAEVLVKDVAPRLRKRGIECEVAVLRRLNSPLEIMLQEAGVPLHSTGAMNLYSPRQVAPLARLMRHYDIVHVHLFPAQLWADLGVMNRYEGYHRNYYFKRYYDRYGYSE